DIQAVDLPILEVCGLTHGTIDGHGHRVNHGGDDLRSLDVDEPQLGGDGVVIGPDVDGIRGQTGTNADVPVTQVVDAQHLTGLSDHHVVVDPVDREAKPAGALHESDQPRVSGAITGGRHQQSSLTGGTLRLDENLLESAAGGVDAKDQVTVVVFDLHDFS